MLERTIDRHDFFEKGRINSLVKELKTAGSIKEPLNLQFSGFDHDSRELCEIPEFVKFVKKLNKRFNGWLTPRISKETIKLVITTLTVKNIERKENRFSIGLNINHKKWKDTVSSMCINSEYGLNCAAQIAFSVFPEMIPGNAMQAKHSFIQEAYISYVQSSELAESLAEHDKLLLVDYVSDCKIKINVFPKSKILAAETYLIEIDESDMTVNDISKINKVIIRKD